jgi:large subunit ribosomal protein L24
MKIKKGDMVKVIAGKKGQIGRVLEVLPKDMRVKIEGVAPIVRHIKPQKNPKFPEGGIIKDFGTVHASKVMLYSEALGRAVRLGTRVNADGKKVRVAKGRNVEAKVVDA